MLGVKAVKVSLSAVVTERGHWMAGEITISAIEVGKVRDRRERRRALLRNR